MGIFELDNALISIAVFDCFIHKMNPCRFHLYVTTFLRLVGYCKEFLFIRRFFKRRILNLKNKEDCEQFIEFGFFYRTSCCVRVNVLKFHMTSLTEYAVRRKGENVCRTFFEAAFEREKIRQVMVRIGRRVKSLRSF